MASSKLRCREFVVALVLSVPLTIAFFYLTFEIPAILDKMLAEYFPEAFLDIEMIEKMLGTLRPIGYTALIMTVLLIFLGFAIKRTALAFLGSAVLYIPTFSYFASAMFFLTGLGILRSLWLPILEYSPAVLKLGCIAYLPFAVIPNAPLIGIAIVFIGLLIFTFGVITWLYGRFRNYELIDFWIYKYSRHPQYLGFIIWSYGLLIYVSYKPYVRGALNIPPALIWLITTMIVIGVALIEEIEMVKRYGERYKEYSRTTPFMIPLPKPLAKLITLPMRIVIGHPKNTKDVIVAIALYIIILILLSYGITIILGA